MCLIGLCAQNMVDLGSEVTQNMVVLGPEVNIICRDVYDQLMSMEIFALILDKILY